MKIQSYQINSLLRRLFGVLSGTPPQDVSDVIHAVCEVGRRSDFDLLFEQGIQPWIASREKAPPGAGLFSHMTINGVNLGQHLIIVERAEFVMDAASSGLRAFLGTALGISVAAPVLNTDCRYSRDPTLGIGGLISVGDGHTAVSPPAVGTQIWRDHTPTTLDKLIWEKHPILLRPTENVTGNLDQLSFQDTVGNQGLIYTVSGYVVHRRAGQ